MKGKIPIWYLLFAAIAFVALFYVGMVRPYIPLSEGMPIDASYLDKNLFVGEKIPPNRYYASLWVDIDKAVGVLFLFLGIVCFALGIIRALNKLGSRQIFLISLFSVLFALMSLTMTDSAAQYFSKELLFYLFWFSFFGYPISLFFHFFDCLSYTLQRWLWLPVFLTAAYSTAAFVMYFGFGLPFDMPERLYTYISLISAIIYLAFGSFMARDIVAAWYMRGISFLGIVCTSRIVVMLLIGNSISFHNEYRAFLLIVASFMTFYMLFSNTRELVSYKSGMQMAELKNKYMLENYHTLKNYFSQVAKMKHEIYHHLFAIRELYEKGEHEQLTVYLSDIQGDFAEIDEPVACGNCVIQAILCHAAKRAHDLGFEMNFEILPMPDLNIPDADLVSLFMNLLDNALESCAGIPEIESRWIKVRLKVRSPYLCLSVINARRGKLNMNGNSYATTKRDYILHGQGISIVYKIAAKFGGLASFAHTEDTFSAEVALPIE